MIEWINTYGAEIVSTGVLLLPIVYAVKGRIINDKNLLGMFQTAKQSINENVQIKFDVKGLIEQTNKDVKAIEKKVYESILEMNEAVLAFQEDELYRKMLSGLSQLDELHKTLQDKDSTITRLESELKETHLILKEIQNQFKG